MSLRRPMNCRHGQLAFRVLVVAAVLQVSTAGLFGGGKAESPAGAGASDADASPPGSPQTPQDPNGLLDKAKEQAGGLMSYVDPKEIGWVLFEALMKKESFSGKMEVLSNPYSFANFATEALSDHAKKQVVSNLKKDLLKGGKDKKFEDMKPKERAKAEEKAIQEAQKLAKRTDMVTYYKRRGMIGALCVVCCCCTCWCGGIFCCVKLATPRPPPQPAQVPLQPNIEMQVQQMQMQQVDLEAQLAQIRNPKANPLNPPNWGNALEGGFEKIDIGHEPSMVDKMKTRLADATSTARGRAPDKDVEEVI